MGEETQDQDRRPCPCEVPLGPCSSSTSSGADAGMLFPVWVASVTRDRGVNNVAAEHVDIGGRMKGGSWFLKGEEIDHGKGHIRFPSRDSRC